MTTGSKPEEKESKEGQRDEREMHLRAAQFHGRSQQVVLNGERLLFQMDGPHLLNTIQLARHRGQVTADKGEQRK